MAGALRNRGSWPPDAPRGGAGVEFAHPDIVIAFLVVIPGDRHKPIGRGGDGGRPAITRLRAHLTGLLHLAFLMREKDAETTSSSAPSRHPAWPFRIFVEPAKYRFPAKSEIFTGFRASPLSRSAPKYRNSGAGLLGTPCRREFPTRKPKRRRAIHSHWRSYRYPGPAGDGHWLTPSCPLHLLQEKS